MKERFKFRVWNKQQQKLYSWNDLKETKKDGSFFWCMIQAQNDEKYNILMQCTGLKDKNGKLIYEGDIVKIDGYGITGVYEMRWCDVTAKFVVNIYEEDCFEHSQSVMEVIGNIYENKELLGEQK